MKETRSIFYGFGVYIFIIVISVASFLLGFYGDSRTAKTIFVRDTLVLETSALITVDSFYVESGCLYCPPGYHLGEFAGEPACFDRDGWWSSVYPIPKKSKVSP